jgi:Ca-activated chloride channel homolog
MRIASRSVLVLTTLAALTGVSPLTAQGVLLPRICDRPLPRPLPPVGVGSPQFFPCPVTSPAIVRTRTDVRVRLVDRVLRYEVDERFVNRGNTVGEADYVFPLPRNAAFQDLQLEINGELVSGETFGADEARRMYEEIVRRQRDPALVEWMGQGMLRARIFPIAPGEEKRVLVRFQSVAQREGDALRIDYFGGGPSRSSASADPSRSLPRSEAGGSGQGSAAVHLTLTYPARSGLGRAYSPTHELDSHDRGSETEVVVQGDARNATLLIPVARANAPAISVLTNAPGREDGFVMVTVAPPDHSRNAAVTPRDITLVLDVSGSMAGAKMNQARAAGRQLLETLEPQDRFRLIDFSTDVHTFRDDYVRATPENLQAARRYLDGLEAAGSTNIEGALVEAMRGDVEPGRLPLVLFITDGEPTIGERNPERLVDMARPKRDSGRESRRIFAFGLGADVNVTLLEQLALEGRGTSQFVRPDESVERAVGLVASRLVDPVLTDVHVHAEGPVSLTKMQPAAGSDLFAGQDLVVFARYTGDGAARIIVDGRQNGRAVQWTTTATFPNRAPENPFVARLWASQRIGFLSAERRRNGGSPELDAEIRTLGERFSIPTEFTSYFVREPAGIPTMRSGQLGAMGGAAGGGFAPASAPAPRDAQFDAARLASAQRSVSTMAKMDSMSVADSRRSTDANEQKVGGRTFRLDSGVWTDVRPAGTTRAVTIKAYSKAYFDLLKQLPELSSIMGLGEQITVVGRGVVISIRTASGTETLSGAELDRITREW